MEREADPGELLDRVQELTARVDELADPRARELAHELVGTVIAMYGDGLARIMDAIGRAREAGATILDELSQDGAVASLLLIHDLYPVALEARVAEALDTVRPYMESHGGNVELLGLEDGVARLALQGSCNGCSASRATLELAIKQALEEHAPDLAGLEVEGLDGAAANGGGGGFELPMVHSAPPSRWLALPAEAGVEPGLLRAFEVNGAELLLANVDGSLLAYRNACASCGDRLDDGALDGSFLTCPRCGTRFELPRAGRVAGETLQLTPVPLLQSDGVRVAV